MTIAKDERIKEDKSCEKQKLKDVQRARARERGRDRANIGRKIEL